MRSSAVDNEKAAALHKDIEPGSSAGATSKIAQNKAAMNKARRKKINRFMGDKGTLAAGETYQGLLVPHLSKLNGLIEECFVKPADCTRNVDELTRGTLIVLHNPSHQHFLLEPYPRQYITDEQKQRYASLAIDEFLQNLILLAERQPSQLKALLKVLALLSAVPYQNIGSHCLGQLQNIMGAGEAQAAEVIQVLEENVFPSLRKTEDMSVRESMIDGLIKLARDSDEPATLYSLTPSFARWMQHREGVPVSNAVIELAAVASAHENTAIAMGNMKMYVSILDELNSSSGKVARTAHLMRMIANMCKLDKKTVSNASGKGPSRTYYRSADYFVRSGAHRQFMSDLRSSVDKRDYTIPSNTDTIALYLNSIASMLVIKDCIHDLLRPGTGFLKVVLQLVTFPKMHPTILASALGVLHASLSCDQSWFPMVYHRVGTTRRKAGGASAAASALENGDDVSAVGDGNTDTGSQNNMSQQHVRTTILYETFFSDITRGLRDVTPLLQYLGETGVRYPDCCLQTEDGLGHTKGVAHRLADQKSPIMHRLITVIVDIFTFYSLEANQNNAAAVTITKNLNDSKREMFLFACLNTPSDKVRLAVVRCLLEVPIDELDKSEINQLVEMLGSVSNITVGQTEEVIAGSFNLLTKICLDEKSVGPTFRNDNSSLLSIRAAYAILLRNEMRDTQENQIEAAQKYTLSHACVRFLVVASAFPALHHELVAKQSTDQLSRVLMFEDSVTIQQYLNAADTSQSAAWESLERLATKHMPVCVERCWTGTSLETLLQLIIGRRPLSTVGPSAPRVMRRIADVLMGIPEPSVEYLKRAWGINTSKDDSSLTNASDDFTTDSSEDWVDEILMRSARVVSDPLEVTVAELEDEKAMPPYWYLDDDCTPLHVRGVDGVCSIVGETKEDYLRRITGHKAAVQLRATERLLFYIACALKQKSVAADAANMDAIVASLAERIPSPDVYEELKRVYARCRVVENEIVASGGSLNSDNDAAGVDANIVNRTKSGQEILLNSLMRQNRDAAREPSESHLSDLQGEDDSAEGGHENTDGSQFRAVLISASFRVLYALLRYGDSTSIEETVNVLRNVDRYRLLASVAIEMFDEAMIGAKFFAISCDLLQMHPVRRVELADDVMPLYITLCMTASNIVKRITTRFDTTAQSTGKDDELVFYCFKALSMVAAQLSSVVFSP